jgi:hypothetical protein
MLVTWPTNAYDGVGPKYTSSIKTTLTYIYVGHEGLNVLGFKAPWNGYEKVRPESRDVCKHTVSLLDARRTFQRKEQGTDEQTIPVSHQTYESVAPFEGYRTTRRYRPAGTLRKSVVVSTNPGQALQRGNTLHLFCP